MAAHNAPSHFFIPNTTVQERETIADWIHDALSTSKETKWGGASTSQHYEILLAKLGKEI